MADSGRHACASPPAGAGVATLALTPVVAVRIDGLDLPVQAQPLLVGRSLYNKEQHKVFCRVGEIVYEIEVRTPIQQAQILQTIQAAQAATPKK